mgnify:CR=1 FL=1
MTIREGMRKSAAVAGPSVEELAEPRDHGREAGRGESATIRGPGVGPDLGWLERGLAGRDSSVGRGRGGGRMSAPSLPGRCRAW